jgi:hypothetical protein
MSRTRNWLPWVWLAGVYALLVVISWKRWANPIVDCGREMYVPWQIAEGKMLYRDLFFMYGPLVPYWHSVLLKVFGVHLNVLYTVGLILVALQASLVFLIARRVVTTSFATMAAVLFLVQFAIRPTLGNLVFPYSFNADYASALNLLALWLVLRHSEGRIKGLPLLWAGVCVGLSILSKQEIGLAGLAFLIAYLAFSRIVIRHLSLGILPSILLPLVGYGWFAFQLGPGLLLREYLWPREVLSEMKLFHQIAVGTLFTPKAILYLLRLVALSAGGFLLILFATHSAHRYNRWLALGVWIALVALTSTSDRFVRFVELNHIHAANIVVLVIALWFSWPERRTLLWIAAFALLSTWRAPLFAGVSGYSAFYMAASVVVFVWFWSEWVPSPWKTLDPMIWKRCVGIALVLLALMQLGRHVTHYRTQLTHRLTTTRGEMIVHKDIGGVLGDLVGYIQTNTAPNESILLFPEETSLYFLCDRRSPSKYYQFAPGLLAPESKEFQLIADADAAQVRHVFVSNRATTEYGKPYFGVHYDTHVRDWILKNFRMTTSIGKPTRSDPPPPPSRYWPSDGYGIEVYERN